MTTLRFGERHNRRFAFSIGILVALAVLLAACDISESAASPLVDDKATPTASREQTGTPTPTETPVATSSSNTARFYRHSRGRNAYGLGHFLVVAA
jgi:hypothetical protein